jgi:hypothetical protein
VGSSTCSVQAPALDRENTMSITEPEHPDVKPQPDLGTQIGPEGGTDEEGSEDSEEEIQG